MKGVFLFIFITISCFDTYAQGICHGTQVLWAKNRNQCDYNNWLLVFEDDFNGSELDLSKWELQPWGEGALYGYERSQEYNTLDNIEVDNGKLRIFAVRKTQMVKADSRKSENEILEDGLPNLRIYDYTSSSIWTKRLFKYGKFEARIRIPKGKGLWPAFWVFGGNPWEEIDVFEFWNERQFGSFGPYDPSKLSRVHNMTVHKDFKNDGNSNPCGSDYNGVDFSLEFHIFTLIWEKDMIQWLVDGIVVRTDYNYYDSPNQAPTTCMLKGMHTYIKNLVYPENPMSIILNLAIEDGYEEDKTGSYGYDRSPDASTPFPSTMEVDWIRYYEKREPCSIIVVEDPEQYTLDPLVFNSLIGYVIVFDCQYAVSTGEQLELVASSSIELKSGFSVEQGALFEAKIKLGICSSEMKTEHKETELKRDLDIKEESIISLYPNPSQGNFSIDFGTLDYLDYEISIFDMNGVVVFSKNECFSKVIEVSLLTQHKGSFIVKFRNKKNQDEFDYKILIQ